LKGIALWGELSLEGATDMPQDRLLNELMNVEWHLLVREKNISLHSEK